MMFKNSVTGNVESVSAPWLCTFLFGGFYFMFKGVWKHFFLSFLASLLTVGISWFVYPFYAKDIIRNHYLGNGWFELNENGFPKEV